MTTGRVLRFDEARGYGFITTGVGGADIFFHANELTCDKSLVRPGVPVSFEAVESDRGFRAFTVRVLEGEDPDGERTRRQTGRTSAGPMPADEFRRELAAVLVDGLPMLTAEEVGRLENRIVAIARRRLPLDG